MLNKGTLKHALPHFISSSIINIKFHFQSNHACNEETKNRRRSIAFVEVRDRDTGRIWGRSFNEIERVRFEDIL